MVDVKTEKQEKGKPKSSGRSSKMGLPLVIVAIFTKLMAAANLFRLVRWPDGVFCLYCKESHNINK